MDDHDDLVGSLVYIALADPEAWESALAVLRRMRDPGPRSARLVPVGRAERIATVLDVVQWLQLHGDDLRALAVLADLDEESQSRELEAARALRPYLLAQQAVPLMDVLNAIDDDDEREAALSNAHVLGWDL